MNRTMKIMVAALVLVIAAQSYGLYWFYQREAAHNESFALMKSAAEGFWSVAERCMRVSTEAS